MAIDGAAEALAALTASPTGPIEPNPPLSGAQAPGPDRLGPARPDHPRRHGRLLHPRAAQARKVIFEKSGHMPHVEEAERLQRPDAGFLEFDRP